MHQRILDRPLKELESDIIEIAATIPARSEMEHLLESIQKAVERGYFSPTEDEMLLSYYVDYLQCRAQLLEVVECCRDLSSSDGDELSLELKSGAFLLGFAAALVLMRVGHFIVSVGTLSPVVATKLDDAEVRYGLPRKSYTQLYKNLTDPGNMMAVYEAVRYYELNAEEVATGAKTFGLVSVLELVLEEVSLVDLKKRDALLKRLQYKWHSLARRSSSSYIKVMFHLFRLSGSQIAEWKQPHLAKTGKEVNFKIIEDVYKNLQPGDVLITRHRDAMSNLFLPGYWPHAALYIGSKDQRQQLGVEQNWGDNDVVEAKKDGVKFRKLRETLYVDEFLVLRPRLAEEQTKRVLKRAASHAGKGYDFLFNFASANRLSCTELIYRSYEGLAGISFKLIERAGRVCLPAEALIEQGLDQKAFSLVGMFTDDEEMPCWGEELREKFEQHRVTALN